MKLTKAEVVPFYVTERDASGRRVRVAMGFQLLRAFRPGHDEMFERITHPVVFRTEAEAQQFADRVNEPGARFNFAAWCFAGHPCSPLAPTKVAPHSLLPR